MLYTAYLQMYFPILAIFYNFLLGFLHVFLFHPVIRNGYMYYYLKICITFILCVIHQIPLQMKIHLLHH